ncbi:MAG: hypothetical protein HYS44_00015 [Candidatus Niyogibacteria bacterium]|nr:hypothetical protein [Candidatus Niyogibacteria bacterium]
MPQEIRVGSTVATRVARLLHCQGRIPEGMQGTVARFGKLNHVIVDFVMGDQTYSIEMHIAEIEPVSEEPDALTRPAASQ